MTQARPWGGDFFRVARLGGLVNLFRLGDQIAMGKSVGLDDGPGAGEADGFEGVDGCVGGLDGGPLVGGVSDVVGPVAVGALEEDGVGH